MIIKRKLNLNKKPMAKIVTKDYIARNLLVLLQNIKQEELAGKDASFEEQMKALTMRRKIAKKIEEVLEEFGKGLEKFDKIAQDAKKENQEMMAEIDAIEAKTDDEKKQKAKEKLKKEMEITENANKKREKLGFQLMVFQSMPQTPFVSYVNEKDAKDVEFELEEEPHNQLEFLKKQFEEKMFKVGVSDEIIIAIAELLGLVK